MNNEDFTRAFEHSGFRRSDYVRRCFNHDDVNDDIPIHSNFPEIIK